MKVFAGLEGGASSSKLAFVGEDGTLLYENLCGPSTNHWLIGMEECLKRITQMVEKGLEFCTSISRLESLCVCLSGCEDQKTNQQIRDQLMAKLQKVDKCFVASDTLAPLFSCGHSKGIVLIAGTGSNCLLFQSDDVRCGGWGHILGDQGSAFWVAREAIKAVIQDEDNYRKNQSIVGIKELVFTHFSLQRLTDILDKVYRKFDKSEVASLCLPLSKLAKEGDPLAKDIFYRAGRHLGRHVKAVVERAEEEEVVVVCVGSVFKSWQLLSSGFVSVFQTSSRALVLKRLRSSSAIGAAIIGSNYCGQQLKCEDKSEILVKINKTIE